MIKIKINAPSANDLMHAVMRDIEKSITKKATSAAARHGGVTVHVQRNRDGAIQAIKFRGSEAAVQAAEAAVIG